jgi:hypothetical protein
VVPWTTDRVTNNKSFGQRSAVVRAGGADCEQLRAAAIKHNRFAVRVPKQQPTVFNV